MLKSWIFYPFAFIRVFQLCFHFSRLYFRQFCFFDSYIRSILNATMIKVSYQYHDISTWIEKEIQIEREKGRGKKRRVIGYTLRKLSALHMNYLCEFVDNLSYGDRFNLNHSMTHLICCCIRSTWHCCIPCECFVSSWANRILTNEMEYPPEISIRSNHAIEKIRSHQPKHICISYKDEK